MHIAGAGSATRQIDGECARTNATVIANALAPSVFTLVRNVCVCVFEYSI